MKRILILHGWNSNPRESWYQKAKEYLEKKDCSVEVPELPGNYFPDYSGWMKKIIDFQPDQDSILIGHSLGAVTIMRYLEQVQTPVRQVILAAMPIEPMRFTPITPFFDGEFDWEKIKTNAKKINLIYEEGDQVVPLEHGKIAAEKLHTPLTIVPGASHLTNLDIGLLEKIINE